MRVQKGQKDSIKLQLIVLLVSETYGFFVFFKTNICLRNLHDIYQITGKSRKFD